MQPNSIKDKNNSCGTAPANLVVIYKQPPPPSILLTVLVFIWEGCPPNFYK